MSSYRKIILIISVFFFASCSINNYSKISNKDVLKENIFISMALDYEYNKMYDKSEELYEYLFEKNPQSYEYFAKLILLNRLNSDFKKIQTITYNNIDNFMTNNEVIMQEYIIASIQIKEYAKALVMAKKLLKNYNNSKNYTILADVYLISKNYKQAALYYESAYSIKHNVDVLLSLTNVLYSYLGKKSKAIAYLETHKLLYKCDEKVCFKLLRYYEDKQNIEGMLSIANNLLKNYKNENNTNSILKTQKLIVELYLKIDQKKAIEFLETNEFDNQKLLNLYSENKMFIEALNLTKKIYKKKQDDSLLGQIAILEYEINKDKYFKNIIKNFEKTLKYKSNDVYENYYGYLLVDHDINIEKGLKLIKKAYKSNPKNLAYQDSLAYAHYKNNNCSEAYKLMNDIVNKIGLDNQEIKKHWEEIKKCKDNK
jgi:tetratricopeptide (TPR) repeat protein